MGLGDGEAWGGLPGIPFRNLYHRFATFDPRNGISGASIVTTGEPIGSPLPGHTGSDNSVVFSPDGRRILSGSDDKTLRHWDVAPDGSLSLAKRPFQTL
jgi:WD40 repeat protein